MPRSKGTTSPGAPRPKGGGLQIQKRGRGGNFVDRGDDVEGDKPSPSLSPDPISRPRGPKGQFLQALGGDSSVGQTSGGDLDEVNPRTSAGTVDEWLQANAPTEMERFSRIARSGKDPIFRMKWMEKLMDLRIAETKARADLAGKLIPPGGKGIDPLLLAAQRVDAMVEDDLVEMAGGIPDQEEES